MAVRIQFRRGTQAEWSSTNPILAAGELGFETDTKKFKIGTGSIRWNVLDYYVTGTITGVIAGGGLTGGGTTGTVTLSLNSDILSGTVFNNRGDLLTATSNDTPTILPVGSTDYDVLQVDSTKVTGLTYGKVQTVAIANNAVTTAKILDTSITTSKLFDSSVTTAKIDNSAVTDIKLSANSVTTSKINNGAVTSEKLGEGSVTTSKIADLSITGSKFADNIITSAKITNNTILNEDINDAAGIALTKLGTGALPTTITTTTGNYVNRSVTIEKLSNTPGSTGVGVWQTYTPTVYINGSQSTSSWASVYCKYMRLNNHCTMQMVIRFTNLTQQSGRNFKFDLPITPVFASSLQTNEPVILGPILHWNEDTSTNSTLLNAVYRNGLVECWSTSTAREASFLTTETSDIISFSATYEVA